jgi:hypothetical protein
LRAFCDPAVHFGNEIFKDGNKLVVGHQPGHFDEDPAVIEYVFTTGRGKGKGDRKAPWL